MHKEDVSWICGGRHIARCLLCHDDFVVPMKPSTIFTGIPPFDVPPSFEVMNGVDLEGFHVNERYWVRQLRHEGIGRTYPMISGTGKSDGTH